MQEQLVRKLHVYPEKILTDWKRFSCGLWRTPKGDISSAYCADTFPRLKTFTHAGEMYANLGATYSKSPIHSVVCAYALVRPREGARLTELPHSYQGQEGIFGGERFWLGPCVKFESSDPTVLEWRNLLRAMYADGGYFANQSSYAEFLATRADYGDSFKMAAALELEHEISRFSKLEVAALLESNSEGSSQMTFLL